MSSTSRPTSDVAFTERVKAVQSRLGSRAAYAERAIVIRVTAWDANCPQHIPQRFDADDVKAALAERDARIAALEAEVKQRAIQLDGEKAVRQEPP
jgi:hypothetical protein